jgi:hypothetical protein
MEWKKIHFDLHANAFRFWFNMRFPCINRSFLLCVTMQFLLAGCAHRPEFTVEPTADSRPTKSANTKHVIEGLTIIDDRQILAPIESQHLGFSKVIRLLENRLTIRDTENTTPSMYLIDPSSQSDRNHGISDWVREQIARFNIRPTDSLVIDTYRLSMTSLCSILSALRNLHMTVSLLVPLGLLAYTHECISAYRDIVHHYFYHISGFWIPNSSVFSGPLYENPFYTWRSGSGLLDFLTGESGSIGSPIPRRDLDMLSAPDLGKLVTVLMSPYHDTVACVEPKDITNCTNINRVTEFGILSRNQFVDFITAFRHKYKFINGFGLSSYSTIPTSWIYDNTSV